RPKYAGRRPSLAPTSGAIRQPTIAPKDDMICACAFHDGFCAAPGNWPTHAAIFWTEPQVPISAIDAKTIASTVVRSSAGEKTSRSGRDGPCFTDSCQRRLSGTHSRMKNVSSAGSAPESITQRHDVLVTGNTQPA